MTISDPVPVKSSSYRVCERCGAECGHLDIASEADPCWGHHACS